MFRTTAVAFAVLAAALLVHSGADAGAKDGKIRWTHKKTGAGKALDPIVVPAAANNKPGIVELKIVYEGGKLAEFFLVGDGDTDLDVIVKDAAGKTVAQDVDPSKNEGGGSDLCVCRWRPKETAEFTIIIINNDPEVNIAQAGTN